jgi:hypothetical protein
VQQKPVDHETQNNSHDDSRQPGIVLPWLFHGQNNG